MSACPKVVVRGTGMVYWRVLVMWVSVMRELATTGLGKKLKFRMSSKLEGSGSRVLAKSLVILGER